jgi:hypothetical protein
MTTYQRGEVYVVGLAALDPGERGFFVAPLGGYPGPLEEEESAYPFDFLWFRKEQRERRAVLSMN